MRLAPTIHSRSRSKCFAVPGEAAFILSPRTLRGPLARLLPLAAWLLGTACFAAVVPCETHSFSDINKGIPDGTPAGLSSFHDLNSAVGCITSLRIKLRIDGQFNGDLYGYLRHINPRATNFCVLLNRPGRTAANLFGYGDAGLDVTFADDSPNGDIHLCRNLSEPSPGKALTGLWQPDGRSASPYSVLDSSPRTAALASFAGVDASGEWTLFLADLSSGGTNILVGWDLELWGTLLPTITWSRPDDIIYGAPLGTSQLSAVASFGGTNVPGVFSYNPPLGTVLNSGSSQTLSVDFLPADTNVFQPVSATVILNVAKAPLLVTVDDVARVYGGPDSVFTSTVIGVTNGDTIAIQHLCSAAFDSPAGFYPIEPCLSGSMLTNYQVTARQGTLTIQPASCTGMVSSSMNPSPTGQNVVFTLALTAVAPSSAIPTGTVQFKVDDVPVGPPALLIAGVASYGTSSLSPGLHRIQAEYGGDGNFVGTTNDLEAKLLINAPPLAATDYVRRAVAADLKILIADLLANDHDPDGDPVSLLSVDGKSDGGCAVTQDGSWVYYTPSEGFTNADTFSYTISDTHGATAYGLVQIAVTNDEAPAPNLRLISLGETAWLIRCDGIPYLTYRVQYAASLSSSNWNTLGSGTADWTGRFDYTNTLPADITNRFYRTVCP